MTRLERIRRRALANEYLATMDDPASLVREPTLVEREEFARTADRAGERAGAAWAARRRGF